MLYDFTLMEKKKNKPTLLALTAGVLMFVAA